MVSVTENDAETKIMSTCDQMVLKPVILVTLTVVLAPTDGELSRVVHGVVASKVFCNLLQIAVKL